MEQRPPSLVTLKVILIISVIVSVGYLVLHLGYLVLHPDLLKQKQVLVSAVFVNTDKRVYEPGEKVIVNIANKSSKNHYLLPSFDVETKQNDKWLEIKSDGCGCPRVMCKLPIPQTLKAEEPFTMEWNQQEADCPSTDNDYSALRQVLGGVYRIKIEVGASVKDNQLINPKEIYSNEFAIKEKSSDSGKELKFETLEKESYSGHSERKNYVIKDAREWKELLDKIQSPSLSADVNFSESMVIAAFQGEFPTGGYGIEITKVIEAQNNLKIFIKEISPGPDCAVIEAFTRPYHIIKLRKIDKEAVFETESETTSCKK